MARKSRSRRIVRTGLDELRAEAERCRRCDLWRHATQTVFGEGPSGAEVMLVGEQPGDVEDIEGRPFVGPAGRLLAEAMSAAGLDRARCYVTNAVKHFKWEPRGKRRIHKKPATSEIVACQYWLEGEVTAVRPRMLVALGATALRALVGTGPQVTKDRGQWLASPLGPDVLVTVHPSSILRITDRDERQSALAALVADLGAVVRRLHERTRGAR